MKFAKVALWVFAVLASLIVIVCSAFVLPSMGGPGAGAPLEGVAIILFLIMIVIAGVILILCLKSPPKNEFSATRVLGSFFLYLTVGAALWLAMK
jgi:hypothetical protein